MALPVGLRIPSLAMINSMFWTEMTIIYDSVLHMYLRGVQLRALIFLFNCAVFSEKHLVEELKAVSSVNYQVVGKIIHLYRVSSAFWNKMQASLSPWACIFLRGSTMSSGRSDLLGKSMRSVIRFSAHGTWLSLVQPQLSISSERSLAACLFILPQACVCRNGNQSSFQLIWIVSIKISSTNVFQPHEIS